MIKLRPRSQVAAKLSVHADPKIEREFANVYRALARVDMGNFSWNYDAEGKRLILQVLNENTGEQEVACVFEQDTKNVWAGNQFFNNYGGGSY